jgi:integrase
MASLENRTGYFNIVFRFGGRKFTRSLGTRHRREAETRAERLEENIRLVESGRLTVPRDADIATFLLSDGKIDQKIKVARPTSLTELFEAFFAGLPEGNLEPTTIKTIRIHSRHLMRLFGARIPVGAITQSELQNYIAKRSKEPGRRGRNVSPVTIKKEVASLRSVWNWGAIHELTDDALPSRGLRYPKSTEAPPFQTWDQIERRIKKGGLLEAEEKDLWDCLFLSQDEINDFLEYVATTAGQPTIYPMFVAAAHTGARRSELLRSQLSDIEDEELIIRERKRDSKRYTTRRVPLSSHLKQVLDRWRQVHPGGNYTFCLSGSIPHSGKQRTSPQPLTPDEANDVFRRTVRGSRWHTVKGWHCLRHSFISNLAREGVDQRLIDSFVGHTTEAMRRRYTHLFPDSRCAAMRKVYG